MVRLYRNRSWCGRIFCGSHLGIAELLFKIGLLMGLSACLVSCAGISTPIPAQGGVGDSLLITLTTPEYTISQDAEGYDVIQMEGFSLEGNPGEPSLPLHVYSIAVPPNADLESVKVEVEDFTQLTLEGSYKIKPALADQTGDQNGAADDSTSQTGEEENMGGEFIKQLSGGQMRKWLFTRVAFSPFQYDESTGSLRVVTEVQLRVNFDLASKEIDEALLQDDAMDDVAKETFINYESAKDWYIP